MLYIDFTLVEERMPPKSASKSSSKNAQIASNQKTLFSFFTKKPAAVDNNTPPKSGDFSAKLKAAQSKQSSSNGLPTPNKTPVGEDEDVSIVSIDDSDDKLAPSSSLDTNIQSSPIRRVS